MINKYISKVGKNEIYDAYKLFFNTLSSEQRLRILNLLKKKSMNVSEIVKASGIEQTAVSHNLGRLERCGFITKTIKGKYRYYKINDKTIRPILKLIDKHMEKNCLIIIKNIKMKGGKKKK